MAAKKLPAQVFVYWAYPDTGSPYLCVAEDAADGLWAGEKRQQGRYRLAESVAVEAMVKFRPHPKSSKAKPAKRK